MMRPSEREEEFFAREEYERRRKTEEDKQKQMAAAEKAKLKDLHYMSCPKCGMKLIEIDYKSIKVDKCSECQGVWLDAGELEAVSKMEKGVADKFFSVFKK